MTDAVRPKALVFGRSLDLLLPLPALLSRAGFDVTLVTWRAELKALRHVAHFIRVPRGYAIVPRARAELAQGYGLVVAGDDLTLRAVRDADMPLADKVRLLPIASERGLAHIASKIGLSQVLRAAGVTTPDFRAARVREELAGAVAELGYPVMVKADFGMGSGAVNRLNGPADLAALRADFPFPALVQRAIDGTIVDNSGFFRLGEPMTLSSSTVLATTKDGNMGLTRARRYAVHPERDTAMVEELRRLGRALDADGFLSLGAIRSSTDGRLYFYEADARPTVWVEYPKYFGADPAAGIARAYGLPPPAQTVPVPEADFVDLAHGPRLTNWDVISNRYNWRGNFEDYLGRGVLWDRFDRWRVNRHNSVHGGGRRLTPHPVVRLRKLARRVKKALLRGLPPRGAT